MAAGPVFMRGKGRHLDIQAAHAAIRLRFAVGREVLRSIGMPGYFSVTTWAKPVAKSWAARRASLRELPAVPISTSMLPVVRCWL